MVVLHDKLIEFLLGHTQQVRAGEILLKRTVDKVEEIFPSFNDQSAASAQRLNELSNFSLTHLTWLHLVESRQRLTCYRRRIVCSKHTVASLNVIREVAQQLFCQKQFIACERLSSAFSIPGVK